MIPRLCIRTLGKMRERFIALYGHAVAERCLERLCATVGRYGVGMGASEPATAAGADDIMLITYADMVRAADATPLSALRRFLKNHVQGAVKNVHLLPFFPWSSDDGFSVIDYRAVNPEYGTWPDVQAIGRDFGLMFDLVINHVSRQSKWFRDYTNGIAPARHYFIEVDPARDFSAVVRPRTSPLLAPVITKDGQRHVWTTFSDDQIDLNFANPDVLFEFYDILLLYLARGARIMRLDAIAYLWKEVGTDCIHRPETHAVVKLLRDMIDMVTPAARLLTETNVPHDENISYFGDGDEAHMVYQFALPPLLLHAVHTRNAETLTAWAASLSTPPPGCAYFNFTASHDGIGVRPLQGLVDDDSLQALAQRVLDRGGRVSRKQNSDGTEAPYELNISYLDALSEPDDPKHDLRRFLTSQAVMLELQGVPAVYFHSLFGTRNDLEGVARTGMARRINRRKFTEAELRALLEDKNSEAHAVFKAYDRMLRVRGRQPAFAPAAAQDILKVHPACFALRRRSQQPSPSQTIVCVSNFSGRELKLKPVDDLACLKEATEWSDVFNESVWKTETGRLTLAPWQTRWLAV